METHEAWRKLIEWKVPDVLRLLEDQEIPDTKNGTVGEVGLFSMDYVARKTNNGSFTRVTTRHPELGMCVLWYSYRTCIAKLSLDHCILLKTTYRYSVTTCKHVYSVNASLLRPSSSVLHYEGDVGNDSGELTPEAIAREAYEKYVGHIESFPRIRNLERWLAVASIEGAEYERVMDQLNVKLRLPELQTFMKEKGVAKLLGTGLNNPGIAREIARYNALREELNQWH